MPTVHPATSRRWRATRAWVFALVATLLAASGHAVGGGMFPDPAALVTVTGVMGAITCGLARKQLGLGPILGLLSGGQVAFHLLFDLTEHAGQPLDLPRMAVFHLVAAALTALVLARGERALFQLLGATRRWVPMAAPAGPVEAAPVWTARIVAAGAGQPQVGVVTGSPRRGPPPAGRPSPLTA